MNVYDRDGTLIGVRSDFATIMLPGKIGEGGNPVAEKYLVTNTQRDQTLEEARNGNPLSVREAFYVTRSERDEVRVERVDSQDLLEQIALEVKVTYGTTPIESF